MDKILQEIANWINEKDQRILIGISGHGASGKTTFTENLKKLIQSHEVNHLNTDPYIIDSHLRKYAFIEYTYKNTKHRYKMTACHPAAHNVLALERDIHMIRQGLDLYTIGTHYMESTLLSAKSKVTILEGMSVAFIDPGLFDLAIYLHTDGETELMRRSERDVVERGRNIEGLRQSHEERRIQYNLFMHPCHRNFDIVLNNSNGKFIL